MTFALAYMVNDEFVPLGKFKSIAEAERAVSVINFERRRVGLPLVVAVVDRATLTVQKWL